jgi:uncharacterized membrane protein YfcA
MSEIPWILAPLLFFVALAYTSVGLGGGSSYLALFILFGIPLAKIPPIVLFFNITAASVALYKFSKRGYFVPKLVFPFLLASIPATFFGARWHPDERLLSLIFATALFFIALILFFKKKEVKPRFSIDKKTTWFVSLFLGALLGILAGIMGIGGGVFLGPVLLLLGFASPKYVAGICSAFVLVNSAVGLLSHSLQGGVDFSVLFFLGIAVFAGAQVGSFLGTRKFSPLLLQRIFAFILLAVSLKLGIGILG